MSDWPVPSGVLTPPRKASVQTNVSDLDHCMEACLHVHLKLKRDLCKPADSGSLHSCPGFPQS